MLLDFRIQLHAITKPPVWRELAVPADFSFLQFHKIIQRALGWEMLIFSFSCQAATNSQPWIEEPDETCTPLILS